MSGKDIAKGMAAVFAAASIAAPVIAEFEGRRTTPYLDPVKIWTVCDGVTKGVVPGRVYSNAECDSLTGQAIAEHGFAIAGCLPAELPVETRAAFTVFAYNIGAGGFCGSSIAVAARAGKLALACKRLNENDLGKPQWVSAGGKVLPGLVKRRAAERALCEKGLAA